MHGRQKRANALVEQVACKDQVERTLGQGGLAQRKPDGGLFSAVPDTFTVSEDGAVLHPEPGDSTDYKAHNGDIVLSDTDPGYWTLQLAAMEGRKDVVSAYFDVDVDSDGGISIKGAGLKKEWILVLVALDQQDRPFLLYGTNAKVSDRDDVSLKSSEIMNFSMTFKMLKGTNGEQFHAWGLVTEDAK